MVDLVLFVERAELDGEQLRRALELTFTTRGTHPLPESLPPPPASWAKDFPGMADEAGLSTRDHLGAFSILERFWAANSLGGA